MVLTRVNSITKVEYRNDPTIFGWELINEPRCTYESSSNALQVGTDRLDDTMLIIHMYAMEGVLSFDGHS